MGCWSITRLSPALSLPVPWVEREALQEKCLAQEHNTARVQARTTRSGDECTIPEANIPHTFHIGLPKTQAVKAYPELEKCLSVKRTKRAQAQFLLTERNHAKWHHEVNFACLCVSVGGIIKFPKLYC